MIILYGCSIAIILYYIMKRHRNAFVAMRWKAAASSSFLILAAALLWTHGATTYGGIMMIGLLCGAIGDVLLALPYCYPEKQERYFLGGLSAFLIGHVAYSVALYHTTMFTSLLFAMIALVIGGLMILILNRLGVDFQTMKLPCLIYAAVIVFMELQALTWLCSGSFGWVLNIGSLLFVISDLILVFIIFDDRNTYAMNCANLGCYYTAQLLLITTILFAGI